MENTTETTKEETNLITAPSAVDLPDQPKEKIVAYVIEDKYFSAFEVQKSDNAWWMDETKVKDLIKGFKNGLLIKEACFHIGITKRQYQYFVEVHPEFCDIREMCVAMNNIVARSNITKRLNEGHWEATKFWLERKIRDEFGKEERDKPSGEGENVLNNYGNIIALTPELSQQVADRLKQKNAGQPI